VIKFKNFKMTVRAHIILIMKLKDYTQKIHDITHFWNLFFPQ